MVALYICQAHHVFQVIKPREWPLVACIHNEHLSYDAITEKYIECGMNGYLNQLIADYSGNIDISDEKKISSRRY